MQHNPHDPAAHARLNELLRQPVPNDATSLYTRTPSTTGTFEIDFDEPLVEFTWTAADDPDQPGHYTEGGQLLDFTGHDVLPANPAPSELGCGLLVDLIETGAEVNDAAWRATEAFAHLEHLTDTLDGTSGVEHALAATTALKDWTHPLAETWKATLMRAVVTAITHSTIEQVNRSPQHLRLHSDRTCDTQPRCSCGRYLRRDTIADLLGHRRAGTLDTRLLAIWYPHLTSCAHQAEHLERHSRLPRASSALHQSRPTRARYLTGCVHPDATRLRHVTGLGGTHPGDVRPAPARPSLRSMWLADNDDLGDHG